MSAQNLIEYIKEKKVLILGFGREGKSTYNFIRKYLPGKHLTIGDKNNVTLDDRNVSFDCGDDYLEHLGNYDLVFKSPGIPFVGVRYPDTTEITCQTDMFLRFADCTIVGITGTKGKTTTSTLTYRMLVEAGFDVSLIGNMGIPVFEKIDMPRGSFAVIEMSSHQLEFTRSSPHVAVMTNVYEEHLDHYEEGFRGYVNSKLNIVKHQKENDFFVFNGTQGLKEYIDTDALVSTCIKVYAEPDTFVATLTGINNNLRGRHNAMDIGFASAAAKAVGADEEAIRRAIEKFEGIPNRMEYFGTYSGIDYYNDSIATIPEAVLCAVEAIGNVGTLMIGGLDRGIDYTEFEKALAVLDIDNLVCLPETGHNIADNILKIGTGINIFKVKDMEEAVDKCFEFTQKGKACIMSPAAASYNYYRDFEEKGNHFKELVKKHG
ncbi:MAG: UDP-N-acetylmuramoyl-L-alanine--D-glutamate ligase [Clostridia bacterium]|nr:UDP-N-acetylmuramoyl-L-alanine--D-glutamate ligase [Clostridia bacterium]